MKYLPFVWAALWHKPLRTVLTLLSIVVAFLLFGLLQGVNQAFTGAVVITSADRLLVSSKFSFLEPLPIAYLGQIEAVPGVKRVAYLSQFAAYYQDPKNSILVTPIESDRLLPAYPEIRVSKEAVAALKTTRTGMLVGKLVADAFGWKPGDRIPLHSSIIKADGSTDWAFDVVGIYDSPDSPSLSAFVFPNYQYFDEARAYDKGTVLRFVVQVADPARAAEVANAIDRLFSNSPGETKTQSQREYSQSLLKQFGEINLVLDAIVAAVFFTLLLITANTMMQSVRERIPDFAVLKTMGFSDLGVLALVLAEVALLCVVAAGLGLALSVPLVPILTNSVGVPLQLPAKVAAAGMAAALLVALIAGLPPALRVKRLAIVDALAER
ncbi:MAG TPA: FtsX-like permease family protein [Alphaproteobacteria bacterium]|nr:FtsX-like permease family protein [Alphaproteobacteria bacterium]